MEYYTSISSQAMPKDFTGFFLTSWDDSLWILKVFVNGDMIDFVDNIDPEEDSVEAIVYRYNLSIDDVDAEEFELFVDETLVDELEENLVNFPLEEEIDIFPDDDDDDDADFLLSPQERAEIESEREDEAEDAFTRFCDN